MNNTILRQSINCGVVLLLVLGMSGLVPSQNVFARPSASTDVGGLIDTDTTWNLAGSPYIVLTPVLVMEGVTLTIDAGVTVKFASHKALQIDGELHAVGTSGSPITFTSNIASPNAGDWDYILFTNTSKDAVYDLDGNYQSGSILKYVVIEYGGGANLADNAALRLNAAAPFITYTTIRYNVGAGLRAFNRPGTLKMTYTTITDNSGVGISVTNNAGYTEISDSTISNNINSTGNPSDGGGIYVEGWEGGVSVIKNNTVLNNTASNKGGGIFILAGSSSTISNNLVSGNSIYNCTTCWDAGSLTVFAPDTSTISDNVVIHNPAGGISRSGAFANIQHNIISYNAGIGYTNFSGDGSVSHNIISENITSSDLWNP